MYVLKSKTKVKIQKKIDMYIFNYVHTLHNIYVDRKKNRNIEA